MAAPTQGFWSVGVVLRAFRSAGCELRTAETTVRLEDGEIMNLRYLLAPGGERFVALVDLEDDELVSEGEVQFWERRLQVKLARPI